MVSKVAHYLTRCTTRFFFFFSPIATLCEIILVLRFPELTKSFNGFQTLIPIERAREAPNASWVKGKITPISAKLFQAHSVEASFHPKAYLPV